MSVRDAIRAYNGVMQHLENNAETINIGQPEKKSFRAREEYLNNIIIKFGKDLNIEMEPNNSKRYKGNYSPCMSNCERIQAVWGKWVTWLNDNYKKESIETDQKFIYR